jgi:flagellar basal-body rod protein FlgB
LEAGLTLFTDRVTAGIESALDSVSMRQQVSANNIANMNTPGFKASRVEFESNLARAMANGTPDRASASVVLANTPENTEGNTVDVANETAILSKSSLHFDALVTALNYKFNVLRTAIEGR